MTLEQIRHLIKSEQTKVDALIITSLHSEVALIEQIGHYIINNGGKRLRPLLVLLSALACHYQGTQHINLAAIIEFIHTATLLHDDVVDESLLRRGNDTANAIWGDHSSVLVGDFLYSRAFQMMVAINNLAVMQVMADTTNKISEGEVLQLLNAQDPATSETHYFKVITCKTAILFAAAGQLGALISESTAAIQTALYNYGLNLGIAYQLVDDVLDYVGDAAVMGKNIGDDLAEGKPTLPLIYVLQHGNAEQQQLIHDAIKFSRADKLNEIQQAITETSALTYTTQQAKKYAAQAIHALDKLPDSPYKQALLSLAEFIVTRNH